MPNFYHYFHGLVKGTFGTTNAPEQLIDAENPFLAIAAGSEASGQHFVNLNYETLI